MQPQRRNTKYTKAVQDIISKLGHASNAQIAAKLRTDFDDVSDTTVHRITRRLLLDNVIALAPNGPDGAHRFDANTGSHDHFECAHCHVLRDMIVGDTVRTELSKKLDGCALTGSLLITGNCHKCIKAVNKGGS